MGMFEKDVLFGGERLDKHVKIGINDPKDAENVLLLDAVIVSDSVPTSIGLATKTNLLVCRIGPDGTKTEGEPMILGTLASAIGDKVKMKAPGDLPAVVCFFTTPSDKGNDATVMQFVRRWDGKVPTFAPLVEGNPLDD